MLARRGINSTFSDRVHKLCERKVLISSKTPLSGNTPRIGLFVFVIERLETLIPLDFAELGRIGEFEKGRREFNQPFGIDDGHFAHVLFRSLNQLVVHDPLGLSVKDCAARVNVDYLAVHQRSISLLRILFSSITEKSRTNCFLNPRGILASRHHVQFVSVDIMEKEPSAAKTIQPRWN